MNLEITSLLSQAISTIEELEQAVIALNNEKLDETDYHILRDALSNKELEIECLNRLTLILQGERNSLSQALRIVCSQGKIDPAQETKEMETKLDSNN